jgi:hypothetical protein
MIWSLVRRKEFWVGPCATQVQSRRVLWLEFEVVVDNQRGATFFLGRLFDDKTTSAASPKEASPFSMTPLHGKFLNTYSTLPALPRQSIRWLITG